MATRLIQTLTFTDVEADETVALPHSINVNGTAKVPDVILQDASGFTVTADADEVTVTNDGDATATLNVWLEYKHSMERAFGAEGTTNVTPNPFVAAAGSAGGGAAATTEMVGVLYRTTALALPAASEKVEVMAATLGALSAAQAYFVTAQATFSMTTTDDAFAGAAYALSIWWFDGETETMIGYAESAFSKQQNKLIIANLVVNAVLPGATVGVGEMRMYASSSGSDGSNIGLIVQDGNPGPCMSIMRIPASVVVDAG